MELDASGDDRTSAMPSHLLTSDLRTPCLRRTIVQVSVLHVARRPRPAASVLIEIDDSGTRRATK